MKSVRFGLPLGLLVVAAACSGNIGGGQSTLPGGPTNAPVQQVQQPVATATPNSATNVATLGVSDPQPLPTVAGFGGSVVFPKPAVDASASPKPTPAPNPKASATPPPAPTTPVSIGLTASVVEPTDAPKFAPGGRRGRAAANAPKPLLFIALLATGDVAFDSYPRFAIDVPRALVAKYVTSNFELALFDPAEKSKAYRLAVADRDFSTPAPGATPSAQPSLTPVPATPSPVASGSPSPRPTGFGLPPVLTPPPFPKTPEPGPTLPPARIAFTGPAAKFALKANRAVIFALYVVPAPSPSPSPAAAASGKPAAVPSATPSAVPSADPSAAPSPKPS